LAMFMKPPFVLIGLAFALELLYARRGRALVQLLIVLAASVTVLMTFNYWLARTLIIPPLVRPLRFDPFPSFVGRAIDAHLNAHPHSRRLSGEMINKFRCFFDNLTHKTYGLLWYTPWVVCAFWALARAGWRYAAGDDILAAMSFPILFNFLMLGSLAVPFRNFSPGYCYGPRYWGSIAPVVALAVGRFFESGGVAMRWCLGAAIVAGAVISFSGALRYPHLFEQPFYASLTMEQVKTLR